MRYILTLFVLASVVSIPTAHANPNVQFANAMQKISSSTQSFETMPAAHIFAARNEFEAFQVVIRGDGINTFHNIQLLAFTQDLEGPGDRLSVAYCDENGNGNAGNVRMYREDLVDVNGTTNVSSDTHGLIGNIPDPLVPQVDEIDEQCRNATIATLGPTETRVFWVEAFVPLQKPAGDYTGNFNVTWDGGSTSFAMTITVWNFDLPATATLRSTFAIQGHELAKGFGFQDTEVASIDQLLKRFSTLGLDHRVSISNFDDFGADPVSDNFASYWSNFGSLIGGTAATRLSNAKLTTVRFLNDANWSSSDLGAWWQTAIAHGFNDRLYADIADEPANDANSHWYQVHPNAMAVHTGGNSAFETLVTAEMNAGLKSATWASDPANVNPPVDLTNDINDMVADICLFDIPGDYTLPDYTNWLAASVPHHLWLYETCDSWGCGGHQAKTYPGAQVPDPIWPSYAIDHSLLQGRALEWFSFQNGAAGELYWDTTHAFTNPDPWSNLMVSDISGAGDGTLFYPGTPAKIGGTTNIPIASMRLKMIREGMEDFEYLVKLAAYSRADAQAFASTLFPHAYD